MSRLGQKLWKDVEAAQGRSFVSDAMCEMSDEDVVAFCAAQLEAARTVVRVFERIAKRNRKATRNLASLDRQLADTGRTP